MRITKNFKDLEHRRKLSKAQKKEVHDFYMNLIGKKVPLYCHEYFYSRTGHANWFPKPINIGFNARLVTRICAIFCSLEKI